MENKKRILLITTGGTIASLPTSKGLVPSLDSSGLTDFVPEIEGICSYDSLELFRVDSTNINTAHWIKLAKIIKKYYEDYDGFVITHGTDTLSYTAAALSYMVQNSPKPVVLTGAQKSITLRDTDARNNLIDAFTYAADDLASGIRIVFNGLVIPGTRARKVKTHSYDAFASIDYPAVASVMGGRVIHYISDDIQDKEKKPVFSFDLNDKVMLIKLTPGFDGNVIELLGEIYRALIIEAFGAGGLPENGNPSPRLAVDRFTAKDGIVAMTTQVPSEGSSLSTYEVGRELCDNPNVLEGGNMTIEAMVCKLMWILGKTSDRNKIKELFYTPIDHDIL